jgi:hypothetical protein
MRDQGRGWFRISRQKIAASVAATSQAETPLPFHKRRDN